jgi:hypothetical protein
MYQYEKKFCATVDKGGGGVFLHRWNAEILKKKQQFLFPKFEISMHR